MKEYLIEDKEGTNMTCYKNIGYGPSIVRDVDGVLAGDNLTNVVLPATGKSKLIVVPVLAEDNVQIAYYHYELQFESLIYSSNLVLADTELEIQRLKNILST